MEPLKSSQAEQKRNLENILTNIEGGAGVRGFPDLHRLWFDSCRCFPACADVLSLCVDLHRFHGIGVDCA